MTINRNRILNFNLNDHTWLVATMLGRAVLRYYLCLNQSLFFFLIYFISWRLITLQYWNGFCHTLTWISHGVTGIPHPDAPSHLPVHPWISLFQIRRATKNNEETNLMAVGVWPHKLAYHFPDWKGMRQRESDFERNEWSQGMGWSVSRLRAGLSVGTWQKGFWWLGMRVVFKGRNWGKWKEQQASWIQAF